MPFYNGNLFDIDQKEMMRYAGLNPNTKEFPPESIRKAIREALALAVPKGIWQIFPYDADSATIAGSLPLTLQGNSIKRHLVTSVSVAVFSVTVGDEIEASSDKYFKEGNYLHGLLLDAAATSAVEHLADQVDSFIQKEAARSGRKAVWRFSPGYGDWPVTQQKDLCQLIQTDKIGVRVTAHSMLSPRKSVTAIIGLSLCAQKAAPQKCKACQLFTCPFRE